MERQIFIFKKTRILVIIVLLLWASILGVNASAAGSTNDALCEQIFSANWCHDETAEQCLDVLVYLEGHTVREGSALEIAAPLLSELSTYSDPSKFPKDIIDSLMALAGDPKSPVYLTFANAFHSLEDVRLHQQLVRIETAKTEKDLVRIMSQPQRQPQNPTKFEIIKTEFVRKLFELKVPTDSPNRRIWKMIRTAPAHVLLEKRERIFRLKQELEPTIGRFAPDCGIWQTFLSKIEEAKQVIVDRYLQKGHFTKSRHSIRGLEHILEDPQYWDLADALIRLDFYLGKRRDSFHGRSSDLLPTQALFELFEDLRVRAKQTGENTYAELLKNLDEIIHEVFEEEDLSRKLGGHIYAAYVALQFNQIKSTPASVPLVVISEPTLPGPFGRKADFFVQNLYREGENVLIEVKFSLGRKGPDGKAGNVMGQLEGMQAALKQGIILDGQVMPVHKLELRYEGGPIHESIQRRIADIRNTHGPDSIRIYMTNLENLNTLIH